VLLDRESVSSLEYSVESILESISVLCKLTAHKRIYMGETMEYHLMVGETIFIIFEEREKEEAEETYNAWYQQWVRFCEREPAPSMEKMLAERPSLRKVN